MTAETRQVIAAAMRLSRDQREIVVAVLSEELDDEGGDSVEEVEAAWLEETRRRLAEVRSGAVTPLPWAEAKQRLSTAR
jgi:hypothetical protein